MYHYPFISFVDSHEDVIVACVKTRTENEPKNYRAYVQDRSDCSCFVDFGRLGAGAGFSHAEGAGGNALAPGK